MHLHKDRMGQSREETTKNDGEKLRECSRKVLEPSRGYTGSSGKPGAAGLEGLGHDLQAFKRHGTLI